jgi:hypothetical protein
MFPKKGKVWTYRERGRALSLVWGIPLILLMIAGVYFAVTASNWSLFILAALGLVFLAMFLISSERGHRGEP